MDEPAVASETKRSLRDAVLFAPGRLLPTGTALFVVVVASRFLPLADLGRLGLYVTTLAIGASVLAGWLDQATLRYLPGHVTRGEVKLFLRHNHAALARTTWVAIGVGTIGLAVLAWFDRSLVWEGITFLLLAVLTIWFNNAQFILVGQGFAAQYSTSEFVRAVVTILGLLALLLAQRDSVGGVLLVLLLATACGWIFAFLKAEAWAPNAETVSARTYLKTAWAYGFPLLGWILGAQVLSFADRYIIQAYLGSEAVGIYYANYQFLPSLPFLFAMPLLYSAHTRIMAASEHVTPEQLQGMVRRFGRTYIALTVPLCTAVALLAHPLARLFLGPTLAQGAHVVPWVIGGLFCWNLGMYGHKKFEIAGKTRTMLGLVLVSVVANLALNFLLVPIWHLQGAAVATFASYALYPILVFAKPGGLFAWRL